MSSNDPVDSEAVADEAPLDAPPAAEEQQPPTSEEDDGGGPR